MFNLRVEIHIWWVELFNLRADIYSSWAEKCGWWAEKCSMKLFSNIVRDIGGKINIHSREIHPLDYCPGQRHF
jgi:hypothetical protein